MVVDECVCTLVVDYPSVHLALRQVSSFRARFTVRADIVRILKRRAFVGAAGAYLALFGSALTDRLLFSISHREVANNND